MCLILTTIMHGELQANGKLSDERISADAIQSLVGDHPIIVCRSFTVAEREMKIHESFYNLVTRQWMMLNGKRTIATQPSKGAAPLQREEVTSGTAWDGKRLFQFYNTSNRWTAVSNKTNVGEKALEQVIPWLSLASNPNVVLYAQGTGKDLTRIRSATIQVPWCENYEQNVRINVTAGGVISSEEVYEGGMLRHSMNISTLAERDFNVGDDAVSRELPAVCRVVIRKGEVKDTDLLGFVYSVKPLETRVEKVFVLSDAFKKGVRPGDTIITVNGNNVAGIMDAGLQQMFSSDPVIIEIRPSNQAITKKIPFRHAQESELMDESGYFPLDTLFEEKNVDGDKKGAL